MPSPFKVFRRHQKFLLAALGVLAMVAFVILPVLMEGMGQRRYANPLVVTTSEFGDVHESNLRGMKWRRQRVIGFLEAMRIEVYRAGGRPEHVLYALQAMAPVEPVDITSDEAVVETWLLARRAEQLGLTADDQSINTFLGELMEGKVSTARLQELLRRIGLSENDLFAALRDELLAMRLKRMFLMSLDGVTPAQRWDYFQRLNRKVTIESVPVRVADFLDEVADPDDATLQAFFDRYKNRLYDPNSAEPGFREPRRIDIEYLKADYDAFFQREKDAIPLEEVKRYYDEHKEEYRQEALPTLGPDTAPPGQAEPQPEPGEKAPQEAGKQDEKAEAKPDETAQPESGQMVPPEPSQPQQKPGPATPEAPAPQPTPDSSEKLPAETPSPQTPPEQSPSAGESSSIRHSPVFRLTSFGPEDSPAPETEKAAQSAAESPPIQEPKPEAPAGPQPPPAPAPDEKPESEPAQGGRPTSEAPVVGPPPTMASPTEAPESKAPSSETAPAEQAPSAALPAKEPPAEAAPAAEPPAPKEGPSQAPAGASAPPTYLPLERVEDDIRKALAKDRTEKKIEALLGDVRNALARYHDLLIRYKVDSEARPGDPTLQPPERPDFAALAKQHGLTAVRTGLISALEARQLDIGRALVGGRTDFIESALGMPNFRPEIARDIDSNYYLFWKTDDQPERTPTLDESGVRQRVVRAWKMIEARSLARKEAERLADEARKANKPLSVFFADRPGLVVTQSEPFTWLTYGNLEPWMAYAPPKISEVTGVERPGPDFMRTVFSLKKGEIGAAMNQPQTEAYVVQVIETNPLAEVLWATFLREAYYNYIGASSHDRDLAAEAWLDGIKAQAGFQWDPKWKEQEAARPASGSSA